MSEEVKVDWGRLGDLLIIYVIGLIFGFAMGYFSAFTRVSQN